MCTDMSWSSVHQGFLKICVFISSRNSCIQCSKSFTLNAQYTETPKSAVFYRIVNGRKHQHRKKELEIWIPTGVILSWQPLDLETPQHAKASKPNSHLSTCLCLPIQLSICISTYRSIHLAIYLSTYVSDYVSAYPPIYLPTCLLSLYVFTSRSAYLPVYLFTYLCFYLSTCLSVFLSVHLPFCLRLL